MHAEANIVLQVSVAIVAATGLAFIAKALRQPVILGYIAAGILVGPTQGLGLIAPEAVEPISELGLILLLFMIGLEIDLKKLRGSGGPVVIAGLAQFPIGVALGLLAAPLLGFPFGGEGFGPLYAAVAAALSSTMIAVKLLYDKQELDTLPGRITLGVLVFQDIWAILFLALQPDLANPAPRVLLLSLMKGSLLVVFALTVSRYVLPQLFRFIAKIPELLLIGALAWCFLVAIVAAQLGLSLEMGALIAGVSLSTFPYNVDVIAKVISLRDFFITLFFVTLGAKIPLPSGDVLAMAAGLSGFLVLSRFVTLTPLLRALGLGNRASLIPAINLSQISEFSLVICSIGLGLGHIDQRLLSVVVLTLVLTALVSTYGIQFNHQISAGLIRALATLGIRDLGDVSEAPTPPLTPKPIMFVGFWRHASSVLYELLARDPATAESIGVIDFNPQVRQELNARGITTTYGDVSHPDTLHHVGIEGAQVLVCTLSDTVLRGTTNQRLLRTLRTMAPEARVVVCSDSLPDALALYEEGATFVYVPRLMSAGDLAEVIRETLDHDPVERRREAMQALAARAEVLP